MGEISLMQRISDILGVEPAEEMDEMEYEQRKCDRYNQHKGELGGVDCPICQNKGDVAFVSTKYSYPLMRVRECECMKSRRSIWHIENSGLKDRLQDCTFETFKADKSFQQTMKDRAQAFVENPNNGWFLLGGQVGCGKTHICTAICGEFLKQGKSVKYMLWRDDVVEIKGLVTNAEEYAKKINRFKRADVLYIDDFFKMEQGKRPTSADINLAFEIIDYRYRNRDLITIISSEKNIYDLLEIDEAVGSRIYERCKNNVIELNGAENYRLRGRE